jgi:cytochrome c oxidase subunit 1
MVYSASLIGLIGWGVWAHHMYATGMGPVADAYFTIATLIIAIPTGVKIFNWIATMWGGKIRFNTAMAYATAAVVTFTMGGVSGVMHSTTPHNLQQTDTYFVVAHFHYVLLGGLIMGLYSGFYYWYPKVTGRMMSEKLGKWSFWTYIVGMHMTFFPMHWTGLLGMPRRIFTYSSELGVGNLNMISTIGGFLSGVGVLFLVANMIRSLRSGAPAGRNPWGAATLEWATESPPAAHNFNRVPTVHSREPLWVEREQIESTVFAAPEPMHMPPPSYWPILTGAGIVGTFMLFFAPVWWAPLIGLAWAAICIINWAYEPIH